jgi:hypothetical protein
MKLRIEQDFKVVNEAGKHSDEGDDTALFV